MMIIHDFIGKTINGWMNLLFQLHLGARSCYRPQSRGDNTFGSIRPSVRPSVCQRVFITRGVQNVCACNLLLFRQVGRLRSITLLMGYRLIT